MLIKQLKNIPDFEAGDKTLIQEILHPEKDQIPIQYSLAHATVLKGKASVPHKLKNSEIYYILEGEGRVYIDNESKKVVVGDMIYIPPMALQYIENTGEEALKFLCMVSPAWRAEDEIVLE